MSAWGWLLFDLHTRAAIFGPWAPALIVGIFILIVLASYWLNRSRKARGDGRIKK